MVIGYTTMVLAFLLVFFGIRSYRENVGDGRISFGRALGVGLLIMPIASICYVVTWEIVYFNFLPDFGEKYAAYVIEERARLGASRLSRSQKEIEEMKQIDGCSTRQYLSSTLAFTFLEPLPVGLVMTLISALILRKREPKESLGTGLPDLQN